MNQPRQTYHSPIYREFRAIEPSDWRTVRRFYEEYENEISGLDFEEYFELLLAYTNALFETGHYEKHLLMADAVIETSVQHNLKFFNGEDVFQHALFKKAASFYHSHQLDRSEYILREILRIDPFDADAALFLKKCLRQTKPQLVRRARALAISLLLLSALVICVEMLVVRNFYLQHVGKVELLRNLAFGAAILAAVGGELLHRWRCSHEVDGFVRVLQRRKG